MSDVIDKITIPNGNTYILREGILDAKTYTGYRCTANTDNEKRVMFMKVTRNNYNTIWRVRFRFTATVPNHPEYAYTEWDVDYYGFQNKRNSYYVKVNGGALVAVRYLVDEFPKKTTDNDIYIGCQQYPNNNYTTSGYERTLQIELLDIENCSVMLLDDLLWWKDMTQANWTSTTLDLNTTGYQETSDANSTYNLSSNLHYNYIKAKSDIPKNKIIVNDGTGYFNITPGASFDVSYPILYLGNATLAAGAQRYDYLYYSTYDIDLTSQYSYVASTADAIVYLVGILNGRMFTLDTTAPITTTEPSSADGKMYIPIGKIASGTNTKFYFCPHEYTEHFWSYQNGSFKPYIGSGTVNSVNGVSPDNNGNVSPPIDDVPTANSDNPVKSSALKTALDAKAQVVTEYTYSLGSGNKSYTAGTIIASVSVPAGIYLITFVPGYGTSNGSLQLNDSLEENRTVNIPIKSNSWQYPLSALFTLSQPGDIRLKCLESCGFQSNHSDFRCVKLK